VLVVIIFNAHLRLEGSKLSRKSSSFE